MYVPEGEESIKFVASLVGPSLSSYTKIAPTHVEETDEQKHAAKKTAILLTTSLMTA